MRNVRLRMMSLLLACMLLMTALPVSWAEESAPEPLPETVSAEPTTEPTLEPIAEATEEPTAEPALESTVGTTIEPTSEPAVEPTAEPTTDPTDEPTAEPATDPTDEPTAEATVAPTEELLLPLSEDAEFAMGYVLTLKKAGVWTDSDMRQEFAGLPEDVVVYAYDRVNAGDKDDAVAAAFHTKDGLQEGYIASSLLRALTEKEQEEYCRLAEDAEEGQVVFYAGDPEIPLMQVEYALVSDEGADAMQEDEESRPWEGDFCIENGEVIAYSGNASHLIIPDGVTKLGFYCFSDNKSIRSATMPNSLREIGYGAFSATSLESVGLNDGLQKIDSSAFYATPLKEVAIPGSVKTVGYLAFRNCSSLTKVVLSEGVEEILSDAFTDCTSLSEINWPSTLKSIGFCAFSNCKLLTEFVMPDGMVKLDRGAFILCSNLKSVRLADSLTEMGESAFAHTGITQIAVPGSVKVISSETFGYCDELQTVKLNEGTERIEGILDVNFRGAFHDCGKLESVELPSTLKYIGEGAFSQCVSLKELRLTKDLEEIGPNAFNGCTALTIYVYRDSYAHAYCQQNAEAQGFSYQVIEGEGIELSRPVMGNATVISSTELKLTWNAVEGAQDYELWRSDAPDGKYVKIGETANLTLNDTSCLFGQVNYYKVRAYSDLYGARVYSDLSVYRSCFGLATAGIKELRVVPEGIMVTVSPVQIATGYYIYRCDEHNGLYERIGYTVPYEGQQALVDVHAEPGKTYFYKARAFYVKTEPVEVTYVGPFSVEKQIANSETVLSRPVMGAATVLSSTSLHITWTNQDQVDGYELWRSASPSGGYTKIADTRELMYTDANCLFGKANYYKVRAYVREDGNKVYSEFSVYRSCFGLSTPGIKCFDAVRREDQGQLPRRVIEITFSTVANATGYNVQRRVEGSSNYVTLPASQLEFRQAGDKTMVCTDLNIEKGVRYDYRLQAYHVNSVNGTKYLGPVSTAKWVEVQKRYRALLIGNSYSWLDKLNGTDNSLNAMRDMLARSSPGTPYSITRLKDVGGHEIRDEINATFASAEQGDVSLFYFFGHGYQGGYLVGNDDVLMPPSTLRAIFDRVAGDKIIILNNCFSGAAIGKSAESFDRAFIRAFADSERDLAANGYYVLTASSGLEPAVEATYDNNITIGILTYILTFGAGWNALNQTTVAMEADTNSDNAVSLREAYSHAYNYMSALPEDQRSHPQVYPTNSSYILFAK